MKNVEQIKVNKIIPNKSQPRLDFYEESLEGLAESIKENGLLQPISVRKNGNKYEGTFTDDGFFKEGTWTETDGYYFVGTFKNGDPYNGNWYTPKGNVDSKVTNGK